ncbi:hypothetical protein CISG_06585 [Coccidioides immitis RMSCC 3703]|uniref:Uncharacterized protein n=1 Tax=Coccidioides immitis RMSCC 3703 TaxID=454286 RepID=A0A0J8QZM4_COCIT|nr:hypothetical protein CISG_06585 [Coccidioides immitis RMSCC 3703]
MSSLLSENASVVRSVVAFGAAVAFLHSSFSEWLLPTSFCPGTNSALSPSQAFSVSSASRRAVLQCLW